MPGGNTPGAIAAGSPSPPAIASFISRIPFILPNRPWCFFICSIIPCICLN